VTAQNIIDDARELADLQGSQFVTDADFLNDFLPETQEELYRVVATAFGDHWFAFFDAAANIAPGIATIALPTTSSGGSSFRTILGVSKDPGTPQRRSLRHFNFGQRDGARGEITYLAEGTFIRLEPRETAAGNYRVYYVPAPVTLATLGSTLDPILEQWKGYLSTTLAIRALSKAERDTSALVRRIVRLKRAIVQLATARDTAEGGSIAEVVNDTPRSRLWRR
jgi:hypothetical protein